MNISYIATWLYQSVSGSENIQEWEGLIWFYGISTIVGYLMPYYVYAYILIYDLKWALGHSFAYS